MYNQSQQIVCYNCGKIGHKAYEFKVHTVRVKASRQEKYMLRGTVNNKPCDITLDSCTEVSCLSPHLVDEEEYIGSKRQIRGIHGTAKEVPMAKVLVGIRKYELELVVAVVEGCEETGVLLSLDTRIFYYCMELAMEQRKTRHLFVKLTRRGN